jgi:hypothetical protein
VSRVVLLAPAGVSSAHGVVDQARLLLTRLLEQGHDASLLVVTSPRASIPATSPDPVVDAKETHSALRQAWTLVPDQVDVVWIHWANYGLAEHRGVGSPQGFAHGLRRWRRVHPHARLVLSVHEGWDEPRGRQPLRELRAFLQRLPLERAVQCADVVSVNCDRWLRRVQPRVPGKVVKLVTPTNFPVPADLPPIEGRRDIVVMGGPDERARLLESLRANDEWVRSELDPRARVHNIGAQPREESPVHGMPVVSHGFLDVPAVVDLLSGCRLGVIRIPADVVDKSTVAATYRAFGLATWNFATDCVEPAGSGPTTTADDLVEWALRA